MSYGEPSAEVGRQLREFFESLNTSEGFGPIMRTYIDKLEADGELLPEAARALRESDRDAIAAHLGAASTEASGRWIIVWPF